MSEESTVPKSEAIDYDNIADAWEKLEPGPKARAMRFVYEEQDKLVTELQRQHMEMSSEIAVSVARARAAEELQQEDIRWRIIQNEVKPKVTERELLGLKIQENKRLLEAFIVIGKGII
ncbi:MAG: hypothetical protein EXR51_07725 [Dehalococcoidia bacterium]|nr:hypothetical protein [Dehalococcoidia bacterium]